MPECKYCEEDYSENVIKFHKQRCKARANSKNVGPDNDNEDEEINQEKVYINELTTREAPKVINNCDDVEQIISWLEEETQNKNRKTIVDMLEARVEELEENN